MKGVLVRVYTQRQGEEAVSDAWAACVERAAGGDAGALAELYDGTASLVYGLALRILGDEGAAEETTTDAYMQAWRQAARFDARRGTVARWLLTIARSRAIDRLRSGATDRNRRVPLDAARHVRDGTPGPEHVAVAGERRRQVRLALASLSREQREAVELAYFRGFSHSEIAAHLGAPLGTVKTRIRIAMGRLRSTLDAGDLEASS